MDVKEGKTKICELAKNFLGNIFNLILVYWLFHFSGIETPASSISAQQCEPKGRWMKTSSFSILHSLIFSVQFYVFNCHKLSDVIGRPVLCLVLSCF